MRATYGERLSVAEEMSIMVSGEAIKGMRYIYDNDQGYGIERAVFFQKTADVLCRYEARALEGMIDEPLAAMIHAAEHFTLHRAPEPKIIITGPSGTSQPKIIIAGPSSTPKPDIIIVNPSDVPKSPPTIVVPAPTQATSSAAERRSYSRVDIVTLDGIRVGRSYVPEGYTTSTSMAYYPFDYGISMFSPVQVAFNAVAPELNTILQYSTGQTYVHLPYGYNNGLIRYRHQDGQMFDVMQTMMLHEMDAAEYSDFLAEGILSGAQLIEDISLTAEEQQLLDAIRQAMLTNPSYDGVGGVYLKDVRISIGNRIYRGHSDGDTIVVQVRTSVIAQQYDLNNNQVVRWDVPAVAICATSVENADTARKDFEMLCNNTIQSLEFKAAMQALTVNLATIITTGRRETFEIFLSDKTSGASSYDFGDVILSQDTYELSNGEYVTVPNSLPYAYADDYGNVVATNSALYEPAGMTRLYND